MTKSQENEDFEQVIEKIVFDDEELEDLRIAIRTFTEGKIQAKQLKQKLLLCRSRIVKDISNFLNFCIDRVRDSSQFPVNKKIIDSNKYDLTNDQLQQEIAEKNEFLEVVAEKVNALVIKIRNKSVVSG